MRKLYFDFLIVIIILISFFTLTPAIPTKFFPTEIEQLNLLNQPEIEEKTTSLEIKKIEPLIIRKHTVRAGENLWTIAAKYGTDMETLRSVNMLQSVILSRGQVITVINKKGLIHKVKKGETIENISKKYKVSKENIIKANDLPKFISLEPEQVIFLPGVRIDFKEFLWPLRGRVTSKFGIRRHPIFGDFRFHEGLDIKGPYKLPVTASRDGRVIFAGYQGGYGKIVILSHSDGFITKYGHLYSYSVKRGQTIKKGQIIGRVGKSGWSTGPHLHFEVKKYGRLVNPLRILK